MKIALIGYGKMGREIERILVERGHSIALIVDRDNTDDLTPENLHGVDAAIEFTTPSTAFDNLRICFEAGVPVVCGTTGWTERLHEAEALCRQHGGAFFYASNYSIGVNVFFEVNRKLAELMNRFGAYDVTVEEPYAEKGRSQRHGHYAGRRYSRPNRPQDALDERHDDRARRAGNRFRTPQRRAGHPHGYLRVGSGRAVDHALREKSVRVRYGRSDGSRVRRRQKGNILDEGPAGTGIRAGRAHKNDTKTDRNAVCRPNGRRANKNTQE